MFHCMQIITPIGYMRYDSYQELFRLLSFLDFSFSFPKTEKKIDNKRHEKKVNQNKIFSKVI